MFIKFLKDCEIGKKFFKKDEIIYPEDMVELNDKWIMIILNGLRYDIRKENVQGG